MHSPGTCPVETQPVMSESGQDRRIDDVRDVSGVPPIASELARRSNNGLSQYRPIQVLLGKLICAFPSECADETDERRE
jgi:hypothetical protein